MMLAAHFHDEDMDGLDLSIYANNPEILTIAYFAREFWQQPLAETIKCINLAPAIQRGNWLDENEMNNKCGWLSRILCLFLIFSACNAHADTFIDSMENGVNGWTATGFWHQAAQDVEVCNQANSRTTSWWYGQNDGTCNYNTPAGGTLTSPSVSVPAEGYELRFWSWHDSESSYYDPKHVMISTNGTSFTSLLTISDTTRRWFRHTYDLSLYAGQTVWIRFNFAANDGFNNDTDGWFIDDVALVPITYGDSHAFDQALTIGGSSYDYGFGVTTDFQGNVYLTGKFVGTVDFDPGNGTVSKTSAGNYDIYLTKLSSSGAHLWTQTLGGTGSDYGRAVTVTSEGNACLTGAFSGTVDFDPDAGVVNRTSIGGEDTFTSCFTSSGSHLWTKTYGTSVLDAVTAITSDTSDNVYIVGYSVVNGDDGFAVSYDQNGTLLWNKSIGSTQSDRIYTIEVDEGGNIFLGGWFSGTVDFDSTTGVFQKTSINSTSDMFITKWKSDLTHEWTIALGGTGSDYIRSLALDSNGNIYTGGRFQNTIDFDPTAGIDNHSSNGGYDAFVSKFGSDGSHSWTQTFGGTADESISSVKIDISEKVYAGGSFNSSSVDFDPGPEVDVLYSSGNYDSFLIQMQSDGSHGWAKTFGGTSHEYVESIAMDYSGNLYVTGNFYSYSVDFDPDLGEAILDNFTQPPDPLVCDAYLDKFRVNFDPTPADDSFTTLEDQPLVIAVSGNLIQNPSAEALLVSGEISGWTEITGTLWTQRASDATVSAKEGNQFFFPGAVATGELSQEVDLSSFASQIDTTGLSFTFSGYVRSWPQSPPDTAQIIVEYLNSSKSLLSSFDSGAIGNTVYWQELTDTRIAPVNTRWARIRLISVRGTSGGSNNDGYFDSLSLVPANSLLVNDTDSDDVTAYTGSVSTFTQPANGTLVDNGDDTLIYTPDTNFNGSDSFTYTLEDGHGATGTATVNITVSPVNDPPEFNIGPDQTVNEDSGQTTVVNFVTDLNIGPAYESGQIFIAPVVTTDNAALFSAGPALPLPYTTLAFIPAPNANGTANVTITFQDTGGTANGGDDSTSKTFSITVNPGNDLPTAADSSITTLEDTVVMVALQNFNYNDIDGDSLNKVKITQLPTSGTLLLSATPVSLNAEISVADITAGNLSLQPGQDDFGTQCDSFRFQVHDGTAYSASTYTMTVNVNPVNDPPDFVIGPDQTVYEDSGQITVVNFITGQSVGPANEGQSFIAPVLTTDNAALFSAGPTLLLPYTNLAFTPAPNANGTANVTITFQDTGGTANGGVDSTSKTFNITVNPVNDPPTFTPGPDLSIIAKYSPRSYSIDRSETISGWGSGFSPGPTSDESWQNITAILTAQDPSLFDVQPILDLQSGDLIFTPADYVHGSTDVTITLQDDGGTSGGGSDTNSYVVNIAMDAVASILSLVRADPSPTDASSVKFALTFSEPVTGVDAGHFEVGMYNGTLFGGQVTSVTGNQAGDQYTITVGGYSGEGMMQLNFYSLAWEMEAIFDLMGNSLSDVAHSEPYVIDEQNLLVTGVDQTLGVIGQNLSNNLIFGKGFDNATRLTMHPDVGDEGALLHLFPTGIGRSVSQTMATFYLSNLLYVADEGSGLTILDVSNPTTPFVIGSLGWEGLAVDLKVQGNYAYVADLTYGLRVIDVSDPSNPFLAGSVQTGGFNYSLVVVSDYVYLQASSGGGIFIIDVSNPSSPSIKNSIDGWFTHVALAGNGIIACAGFTGVSFFDVATDPEDPVLEQNILGSANYISISGNRAVIDGSGYVNPGDYREGNIIYDISDVSNPEFLGVIPTRGKSDIEGNKVYVVYSYTGLIAYDVSEPTEPKHLGTINFGGSIQSVSVHNGVAFAAANDDGLAVFNVRTLRPLQLISFDDSYVKSVELRGNYAITVSGSDSLHTYLKTYDINAPEPSLVSDWQTSCGGKVTDLQVVDNLAYIIGQGGLDIYDITDTTNPDHLGGLCGSTYWKSHLFVDGDLAFFTNNFTYELSIIDVSDPAAPVEKSKYAGSSIDGRVGVYGNIAYVPAYGTIDVLDLSDPGNPVFLGAINQGAEDIVVRGDKAYILHNAFNTAEVKNGLQVFDLSDPTNPQLISSVRFDGWLQRMTIVDNRAYVARGYDGIVTIDISDPYEPFVIGKLSIPGLVSDTAIANGFAYTASSTGFVAVPVPIELTNFSIDQTGQVIDLDIPSPPMAGHYTLRAFNNLESDTLPGAVSFTDNPDQLITKAIIVAGTGENAPGAIWDETMSYTDLAYSALRYQGYALDDIRYLTAKDASMPLTPEEHDYASRTSFQDALTWAEDGSGLLIYLAGHGGDGVYQISNNQSITAAELDEWLDDLQVKFSGKIIVIMDFCQSGTFLPYLIPPAGKERVVISSASEEAAYYLSPYHSFSYHFWSVLNGHTESKAELRDSFLSGQSHMQNYQTAMLDADEDGISSGTADLDSLLDNLEVMRRRYTLQGKTRPFINSTTLTPVSETSATISTSGLFDLDGIKQVWADIVPPDFNPAAETAVTGADLPSVQLLDGDKDGIYEASYSGFQHEGDYQITVYAMDNDDVVSMPLTMIFNQPELIQAVSADQSIAGTNSATLSVTLATGAPVMSRVWAEIVPPDNPAVTPVKVDFALSGGSISYSGFTLPGTYLVTINAKTAGGLVSFPWGTSVTRLDGDSSSQADNYEVDNTQTQFYPIVVNNPNAQTHNFHTATDLDWVSFNALAGEVYRVKTTSLSPVTDTVLALFDASGVPIAPDSGSEVIGGQGQTDAFSFTCLVDGRYYVRVINGTPTFFGATVHYDLDVSIPAAGCGWIPSAITGNALDAATGTSIDGLAITASGGGSTLTGDYMDRTSGLYMVAPKCTGIYTVNFDASGYTPQQINDINIATPGVQIAGQNVSIPHLNSPPVAVLDSFPGNEDGSISGNVLGNDSDPENDPLSAILDISVAHGSLTLNSDGSFTYTPSQDFNGNDSFTYHARDGQANSLSVQVSLSVAPVNDAPSFSKGSNQIVAEDSGPQTLNNWATGMTAGPADESGQTVQFNVGNDNNALFGVQPSISPSGVLTYTPAANGNGSATITVSLQDNGGGSETSGNQTFTITVNPVNDAPSFSKGSNQIVAEDSGPQTVNNWATGITAGPADESGQTVQFNIGNDNNTLFGIQPSISPSGILTYTPAANGNGSATVTVSLQDNGGGTDTSGVQTFTIMVTAVNDSPIAIAVCPESVGEDIVTPASLWSIGTSDPENNTLTYLWQQIAGEDNATLYTPDSPSPTFDPPSVGPSGASLTFQLTVTETGTPELYSASDNCTVQVDWVATVAADCPADADERDIVFLNSISDPDGTISNAQWSKISGPDPVAPLNFNTDSAEFTAPNVAPHSSEAMGFQLYVEYIEGQGQDAVATCTVTVQDIEEDIDHDEDVDGQDLSIYANDPGSITIDDFARAFGE